MAEDLGHYAVVLDVLLADAGLLHAYIFSAIPGMKEVAAEPPMLPIRLVKSDI